MPSYNRTRTRDFAVGSKFTKYDYNGSTLTSTTVYSTAGFRNSGTYETILDNVTPNFRKKMNSGAIIMNDLSLSKFFFQGSTANITFGPHPAGWGPRVLSGSMASELRSLPALPSWFTNDTNQAKTLTLTKAYAKMNDADFQALVSVAEFGKTVSLLAGPLHAFYSLTVNYKQRLKQIRGLRKQLKESPGHFAKRIHAALGSAWLQYRYGWTPLMHDIENIKKAYKTVMDSSPQSARLVKRSSTDLGYSYSGKESIIPPGCTSGTREYRHHWQTKVAAGVLYELREQNLNATTLHATGLTLRDLPNVAWELVPYSFVVDWFVNVGDWLSACTPNPNVIVGGSWVTVKTVRTSFTSLPYVYVDVGAGTPESPLLRFSGSAGSYLETELALTRETNLPLPSTPQLTIGDLGFTRSLDALELILQRIKGLK